MVEAGGGPAVRGVRAINESAGFGTHMKDWKKIASGYGLDIPEEQIARIAPALDGLEQIFRPLAGRIPHDVEPAIAFRAGEEESAL